MPDHCPACSSAVRVVDGDEGTSHYEPANVAVDALLSDEAVKAWNQATRAHRHAAHALWASTSPDDYEAGIRGVLEAASTGQEKTC